jgi:hypothetical protein
MLHPLEKTLTPSEEQKICFPRLSKALLTVSNFGRSNSDVTRRIFLYTEYFEAFAASLPHHSSLLNHLDVTSKQIKDTRSSLMEAKDALGIKRADLVQLWTRSQMLEEMIKLLDQMFVSLCSIDHFLS